MHVLTSAGCAVAPSVDVLIAAGVLQGVGAAAGAVLARLLLILGVTTVIAPPVGAALLTCSGAACSPRWPGSGSS